jgi:hypothetical protein
VCRKAKGIPQFFQELRLHRRSLIAPKYGPNRRRMTIQVGICAVDRSLVLVSDTKVRVSERVLSRRPPIDTFFNQPKTVFGARHKIVVAMAGVSALGTDPAKDLAQHLSSMDSIPEFIGHELVKWGNSYHREFASNGHDSELPFCSLFVVRPEMDEDHRARDREQSTGATTSPPRPK